MSENYSGDHPLFPQKSQLENTDSSENPSNDSTPVLPKTQTNLDVQILKEKLGDARQHRVLTIGFKLVIIFLASCSILILLDIILQHHKLKTDLVSSFFELLKYSLTTVLGYLFASEHKK